MAKKSLATIQAAITKAQIDSAEAHRRVTDQKGDYTQEGLQKHFNGWRKQFKVDKAIEDARKDVAAWRQGAKSAAVEMRTGFFPTAKDSNAQLAAEVQLQRILGRGELDQTKALALIGSMEASPARTLLVEEATARGIITDESIEGMLQSTSEEYHAAVIRSQQADSLANMADGQLNYLERVGEDMNTRRTELEKLTVDDVPGADVEY